MRTKYMVPAFLLVAALALTGCGTEVVTTTTDSPTLDTVTAMGNGETLAPPDTAELVFGTSASARDAKTALDKTSKVVAEISSAVKKAGAAEKDVQTADVSVHPEYSHREGEAPRVTGYRASMSVRVKVRDISAVGDVIAAATNAGATEINGPMFTLDDDSAANSEAIERAVADARTRAEAMATAGGRSLGEVLVISETDITTPPIYGKGDAYAARKMAGDVSVDPGQLDVTARVTVVFRLE